MTYLLPLSLLLGLVTGLRTMTALAATCWAAALGRLHLAGTGFGLLGAFWVPYLANLLAIGEFLVDLLPMTPNRTTPIQFGGRLVLGGFLGAMLMLGAGGEWPFGLAAGLVGAVIGTFGGLSFRQRLARLFRRDAPAALGEDILAVGLAVLILALLS